MEFDWKYTRRAWAWIQRNLPCWHHWTPFQFGGKWQCRKCGMIYDSYEGRYYASVAEYFRRDKP